jgi:uncharacterized membrane protein YoaK (UPF0700 family)
MSPTTQTLLHVVAAVAVIAAGCVLAALDKITGAEVLGLLSVVLGWAVNASGVTSGAAAANTSTGTIVGAVQKLPPAPPGP